MGSNQPLSTPLGTSRQFTREQQIEQIVVRRTVLMRGYGSICGNCGTNVLSSELEDCRECHIVWRFSAGQVTQMGELVAQIMSRCQKVWPQLDYIGLWGQNDRGFGPFHIISEPTSDDEAVADGQRVRQRLFDEFSDWSNKAISHLHRPERPS